MVLKRFERVNFMIELKNKQFIIDGNPTLIISGEIHYYRLPVEEWEDRINKLIDAGCNTVSTYVPWLCHEEHEGDIDLEGKTRPELNLVRFIDLCQEKGLYFFLRPGPFIMAEMKNEGIPYWVMEKYPDTIPTTWDGKVVTTKTLDYLNPNFLNAVERWYEAIMTVVRPRLYTNGGNIIAIQLDNEIGMLSWVSNSPDLTPTVLTDFHGWLKDTYKEELLTRYPFDIDNFVEFTQKVISPEESYAAKLMKDLGYYNRYRFKKYVNILKGYAEKYGVKDIPFVVNIHGTSGGRGKTFPIGISQLYEAYAQSDIIPGSDIYFGNLEVTNFHDLYLINSFIDACSNGEQPLASVEFNCGDGNFGDDLGSRYDPSASDFKARMCIAQGNRFINYYLFSGGYNYRFNETGRDGNDRIAITGERHGFAAPVNPEGELSYTYPRLKYCNTVLKANSAKLASMYEEYDNLSFGFIPDYFMTESYYPKSVISREIVHNVTAHRAGLAWDIISKLLLLMNYRFTSINLQSQTIDIEKTKVLVVPCARYMSKDLQVKLVDYLNTGGKLLICGELPQYDMENNPCTILADYLGVTIIDTIYDQPHYNLSVYPVGFAAQFKEVRTYYAQMFDGSNITPIFKVYGKDYPCAFETMSQNGKAIVYACNLPANLELMRLTLKRLDMDANLYNTNKYHGIFMTTTKNNIGERFLHLLNLDGFTKEINIYENNKPLFEGRTLTLKSKEAVMLPLNVNYHGLLIHYAMAEVVDISENRIEFRHLQKDAVIKIETDKEILPSDDYSINKQDNIYYITINNCPCCKERVVIEYR